MSGVGSGGHFREGSAAAAARRSDGSRRRAATAIVLGAGLALSAAGPGALAEEAAAQAAKAEAGLSLELNNAVDDAGVCRLSYVAVNRTGQQLEKLSYDVVVFDKDERVSRFLVLQFGQLPAGKTKVVQFDLADQACGAISRILVNDVSECDTGAGASTLCMDALRPTSRTAITFDT
ncbi:hypothetical protein [Jiella sonneratiae]|uniref:Tat pathway signal sequence domain protein n=1 Tax=Jiella sonneratiae TaxID=2816856 RepID=A0ABS3J484_9HYPH|nr:hypothetical protein [Jiella sonneratiae]MBO0904491.1 hypothetical protein [Jiella sonneratiae]